MGLDFKGLLGEGEGEGRLEVRVKGGRESVMWGQT